MDSSATSDLRPIRQTGAWPATPAAPPLRAREWLTARRGWLGLGGLIASGIVIALSAAGTRLLLPDSVRPIPGWLAGVFGHPGVDIGIGGMAAVIALMFVCYAVVVRAAHQLPARAVLIGVAVLVAVVLLAPPLLSTDVFSYLAYGRIGTVYGANPYMHGPNAIALDPLYPFIGRQWIDTPTAYGPLFTALSDVLTPFSIATNVIAYKGIAALSTLVIVVVVWKGARLRGLNPVRAVALVGLNPAILVFGVGGGHNDMLMLAISLTSVYMLLRRRERATGALIVVAMAVKLTAGVLLPFAFAQSGRQRGGARSRRAVLIGFAVAAGVTVAFSFAMFGTGVLHLLGTLQGIQAHGGLNSISGIVLDVLGLQRLSSIVDPVLDAVFVVCLAWLLRRVWRGELDWVTGAGWATVALLVTAGLLLPWYVGWLVPLAALSSDRRLMVTSVFMTGVCLTTL